jgi:hypothetical protein
MEQAKRDNNKVKFQVEIEFSTTVLDYEGIQKRVCAALIDYANSTGLKSDDEGGYTHSITVNCLSVAIPAIQGDPFPIEEILAGGKHSLS